MDDLPAPITFILGDKEHSVNPDDVTPETTLNAYLREKVHLTGTKRMCLEGGCGCCVVAAEYIDPQSNKKKTFAINSCLVSIFSCHGWKIITNEGIGDPLTKYHKLQKGLAEGNGSQCGFCSSGMIMNMYALLESGSVTAEQVEDSFGGNICRCTGYRPILDSFKKFATADIEDYTPCRPNQCANLCTKPCNKITKSLLYISEKTKWLKVYIFSDLLQTLATLTTSYRLVAGNTARGVYKHDPLPSTYIDITSIKELISWNQVGSNLILGGNISLNETINIFRTVSKQNIKFNYLSKMADHMKLIANVPVRNIGTLAGNLMIKHTHQEFPSDIFLIMETVGATLVIVDTSGNETRVTPQNFLSVNMNKKILKHIILKGYDESYIYTSYKIMPRAQNVHAVINAGFLYNIKNNVVANCTIVYGGINPKFVHAKNTEMYLLNKNLFDNTVLQKAYATLDQELKPDHVLPDASPVFRKNLAISLFYKNILNIAPSQRISEKNKSGGHLLQRPISKGSQEFSSKKELYPLSEPLVKVEALAQTSGQAKYIEDMPDLPDQLFVQFVTAKAPANSVITNIDPSPALKLPEVVAFFGKNDIPGENNWTPLKALVFFSIAEELFCSGKVKYYHQPVGIVVAKCQEVAIEASDLVVITYTAPAQKPLLYIKDVLNAPDDIKKLKVIPQTTMVPKTKGKDVKKVVKGEFYIDKQYHFHMEVQCCNVVPVEDGLDVYASTQWMDGTQMGIANVLGIHQTKINMQVRRIGGGFGGKILRNGIVAAAASLAAYKLNKPVKIRLPLEKNMQIIGKRYPLFVKYEVAVNEKGVIQYLDANLYSDYGMGGNEPVDPYLVECFESGYLIDTWSFSTFMVKTDNTPNCWTRAPGSCEGVAAIEAIMEHVASSLGIDAFQLKTANYNETNHPKLVQFSKDILLWSNISKRKQDIQQYNIENRWKKRGMSVVPLVFTLSVFSNYTTLVSIYHGDGSVAIAHGGIEMGQGINTKVAQVCAYKLGIPIDLISIKPSNTLANANSLLSGGSLTSESVCWSTIKACDILLGRLKPIKDKMVNPTWAELIDKSHKSFVPLSVSTLYFPEAPQIADYPIYATASVEVEVDILTGQHQIIQVDIIEDVGDSMNPIIDIGQLEGAFIMGVGYHTSEEIIQNEQGKILTDRTWNYHPPGAKDIPQNFRIKFPSNNPNNVGVLHSKAIGEPPICLSVAVPLAIRNAVASARKDADTTKSQWYQFDGCTTIGNTFLNSLNNFEQYKL